MPADSKTSAGDRLMKPDPADVPGNGPMTDEQREFADKNHGLLLTFMERQRLDADCYDRLALRYLHAVVRYLTDGALRQYAFSTVLWYHLRSELSNIRSQDRLQQAEAEYDRPPWDPTCEETVDAALWQQIERELTFKQCEAVYLRNQGYKNREIAELCGVRPKAIEKRFGRIRKKLKKKRY